MAKYIMAEDFCWICSCGALTDIGDLVTFNRGCSEFICTTCPKCRK